MASTPSKPKPSSKALQPNSDGYTRLHVTPLDAELLPVVISESILPRAKNISFHTLEAFPENRYGFVELPIEDAEKLKKKFHGAVLRGSKMRIEQARPDATPKPGDPSEAEKVVVDSEKKKKKKEKKSKEKSDKSSKRKPGGEVIEGVKLEDRKIKRGWTVTEADMIKEKRKDKGKDKSLKSKEKADKKKQKREVKSKYTNAPECLFKQKMPEVPSQEKADDDDDDAPKRKKRKSDRQVVVHEFEKTVKHPSFLKETVTTSASEPLTFEEGKGWVNAEGNVVEAAISKRPSFAPSSQPSKKRTRQTPPPPVEEDDETSSSGTSSSEEEEAADTSSDDDSDEEQEEQEEHDSSAGKTKVKETTTPVKKLKVDTRAPSSPVSALRPDSSRPKSSGSATSLTIKIPPVTPASAKVHPLEALYKRVDGEPSGAAADSKPFSFFNEDDDDIEQEEDAGSKPVPSQTFPLTPFTKQDFDFRNIRSAAPTPDTAHPNRTFNFWPRDEEDDVIDEEDEEAEQEDQEMGEAGQPSDSTGGGDGKDASQSSEFQKWFWEHRGDLNRSWKKRRKTASKEKRNRENRARAARAI
ncbi:hypothetical protein BX600DRAFT_474448 [Xylariales sp. PMI_506]|nr:hypothetical protein BX600DRAFT_474448 [Xylariales sp. PMI_506]